MKPKRNPKKQREYYFNHTWKIKEQERKEAAGHRVMIFGDCASEYI